jgi:hypothetical protein
MTINSDQHGYKQHSKQLRDFYHSEIVSIHSNAARFVSGRKALRMAPQTSSPATIVSGTKQFASTSAIKTVLPRIAAS